MDLRYYKYKICLDCNAKVYLFCSAKYCAKCSKERQRISKNKYSKLYRERNKEEMKAHRIKNKDIISKKRSEYYAKNRYKCLEYGKKWREKNRSEYYAKNRYKCWEYGKKWREKNKEKFEMSNKKWREKNKEKLRNCYRRKINVGASYWQLLDELKLFRMELKNAQK